MPGHHFRHAVTAYAEGLAQLEEWREQASVQSFDSITDIDDSADSSLSTRPLPALDLLQYVAMALLKPKASRLQKRLRKKRSTAENATRVKAMPLANACSLSAAPANLVFPETARSVETRTQEDGVPPRRDESRDESSQQEKREHHSIIQCDLPAQAFASILGSASRSSFLVTSERNRTAALLLCSPTAHLTVVPVLVDGQLAVTRAWEDAARMTVEVNRILSVRLSSESTELSSYQRYLQVCQEVGKLEPCLKDLLDDYLNGLGTKVERSPGNRSDILLHAFKKSNVSVGTDVDSFDLLNTWVQGRNNHTECATERVLIGDNSPSGQTERTCLICFETSTDGPLDSPNRLSPCGHTTCAECWQAYLQSAALSGQSANIRCPAIMCPTKIDIFDAAHILFHDNDDNGGPAVPNVAASEIFRRLLQTELDQHGLLKRMGRFCPAASCGRMLIPPADKSHTTPSSFGWNILLCPCGSAFCSDCPSSGRRAHPGMSCETYSQHRERIDSGKADGEYQSMTWLLDNTRPCPNCKFPIEKDGGCNHVWCSKCPTYFCWICGGKGNECNAYTCLKAETSGQWQELYGASASHVIALTSQIEKFRSYVCSEVRLVSLQTNLRKWSTDPSLIGKNAIRLEAQVVEVQLQHAMTWLRGQAFYKESLNDALPLGIQRLEIAVKALEIRTRIRESRRHRPEEVETPMTSDEVAIATERAVSGFEAPNKLRQGRKAHRRIVFEEKSLSDLIAEKSLREQCEMDNVDFLRCSRDAIRDAINYLKQDKQTKSASRRRRCKKTATLPMEAPLNTRKERAKYPWRNSGNDDLEEEEEGMGDGDEDEQEGTGSVTSRAIWKKSKRRVKAQRSHALAISESRLGRRETIQYHSGL